MGTTTDSCYLHTHRSVTRTGINHRFFLGVWCAGVPSATSHQQFMRYVGCLRVSTLYFSEPQGTLRSGLPRRTQNLSWDKPHNSNPEGNLLLSWYTLLSEEFSQKVNALFSWWRKASLVFIMHVCLNIKHCDPTRQEDLVNRIRIFPLCHFCALEMFYEHSVPETCCPAVWSKSWRDICVIKTSIRVAVTCVFTLWGRVISDKAQMHTA